MDTAYKFLEKVETLPPAPALLMKLLAALSNVDSHFDEVVNLISLDQSLTAKLLQICNSAFFARPTRVGNVHEAVTQIGYRPVYVLASMISCSKSFQTPAYAGLNAGLLWKHSVTTAYAAKFVAEAAQTDENLIFTAGLLHDIGKVVFINAQPGNYIPLLIQAASAQTTTVELESTRFGCHHAKLGAALLEHWRLPEEVVATVAFHHHPADAGSSGQTAACVFLGNLIAHGEDYPAATDGEDYKTALKLLDLDAESIAVCEQQLQEQRKLMDDMAHLHK